MFSRTTKDEPQPEPAAVQSAPNPAEQLVPISQLTLDLDPPIGGWLAYLHEIGVKIRRDYAGRDSISGIDMNWLMSMQRDGQDRAREIAERQAAEIEARRVAQLVPGTPWTEIPEGVTAAEMWAQREKDALPRRESVLDHALSRDGGIVFHPLGPDSDAA